MNQKTFWKKNYRLIILLAGILLAIVFVIQNSGKVPVSFLWMQSMLPLAVLLLLTLLAGGAIGHFLRPRR
ncbi:MAG: DUF1049 domain-containing protein [Opitutales bacterium]|nr:DUF1049 domain-containing protein [Opitutales bacterium]MCH8540543.1 hypothetical protein [Opitutales bacterium]